jgi:hypothetical protein
VVACFPGLEISKTAQRKCGDGRECNKFSYHLFCLFLVFQRNQSASFTDG